MNQVKSKKKGIIIAGISAIVLIAVLGVTFAIWNYSRTTDNQILVAGDVYMKFKETPALTIENAIPSEGPGLNDYFEFIIEGKNTYSKPIWYEIDLQYGEDHETRKTRIEDNLLKFRLVEIKDGDEQTVVDNVSYSSLINQRIWVNTIPAGTKTKVEITYRLYMWISSETIIGNTEDAIYDMETWNNDIFASIKVSVNGDFEEKKLPKFYPESAAKVYAKAEEKQGCNPIVEDTDGTVYFSGDNECIDFNYVWYSGKLWRITAINPDGTMKMITQDVITSIDWGEKSTFKDSWIYQWLNEDFKDTLYNYQNIIVQNANWNATKDENKPPVKPPTDASADIVQGDVGLLNVYEYYQSYKNKNTSYTTNSDEGYLNTGHYWVKINFDAGGVRPSVNLKSNIELRGEGTKSNPYTIMIDKEIGKPGELINTRLSGEYVKVDNKVYRIVGIENETTKLTSVDYVRDDNGNLLTKKYDYTSYTNASWATLVKGGDENYWGAYLNNKWLTSELEKYITEGTYYLGHVNDGESYKNSICSESNTTETTKSCTKTSSIWTGKVGLPRVGEMFSSIFERLPYCPGTMVLLTYGETSYETTKWLVQRAIVCYDNLSGFLQLGTYGGTYARPSINLKSEVKIAGGSGTEQDPYVVALPE